MTKLCDSEDLDRLVWKKKELEVKGPQKRHRDRRVDKLARTPSRHTGRRAHAPCNVGQKGLGRGLDRCRETVQRTLVAFSCPRE